MKQKAKNNTAEAVLRLVVVFSMITKLFPGLIKEILKYSVPKSIPMTVAWRTAMEMKKKKAEKKKVLVIF
jgi:hypothetical protein